AGFENGDDAGEFRARSDVAEAEGEECGAAHVQIGEEAGAAGGGELRNDGGACGVMQNREGDNERDGPDDEKSEERKRAVVAEERFAAIFFADEAGDEAPGTPRPAIKDARDAEAAGDAARKDDGLEDVPEDHGDEGESENGEPGHRRSLRWELRRFAKRTFQQ